jgi:hypothetical protein
MGGNSCMLLLTTISAREDFLRHTYCQQGQVCSMIYDY